MSTYPRVTAYIVRAETLFRASFSIMLWRWVTTVAKLMLRREAISLLMRPFTIVLLPLFRAATVVFRLVVEG